ncbi:sensor histidine kinase [Paenibacillus camelliae]|uniref:sensor histidine kinase n=1 Tax=Paenibacillus camelliae TaxID=512410 RepID=UPI00203FC29F|nr:histidine kinase [Paenibacillus camelliae]MCM3635050.1 histidine kinase [Paenibacillus camelliae]
MKLIKGSIISKIIISLIIATTIPFIISNYLSYQITGKEIKKQYVELNQNSMSITMSALQSYLHDLSLLGLSYFSDPALVRLLSSTEPQSPAESVYIAQRLGQIYANYGEVGTVSYKSALTNKQFNIRNTYNSKITIPDFRNGELSYAHSELQHPFQVTNINRELRLRVNKPFIDISTRDVIGITTFDVKTTQIQSMLASLTTSEQGPVYMFIGKEMELLYATESEAVSSLTEHSLAWHNELEAALQASSIGISKGELQAKEGSYVYYRETVDNGLTVTLVKFIPQALINEALTAALGKTLSIQVISIVFVSILAAIISYYMLRRIKHMLRNIKKLQMGNFRLMKKAAPATPDELDLLEIRFQEMAIELDELWNKQYRHQLELSQARLKMLQAQINPHFFYNTLQSIGTLAIKSNASEVSDRLAEFAALFRYSMDIEKEDVLLWEEIEHLKHYMVLQQGRYKQKLQFELKCPEEAHHIHVPKMMLQPLIENSIIHGLERGQGHIHIVVDITLSQHDMLVEVIDNGKGFTEQQIEQVKASYVEQQVIVTERQGIGLSNVLKRLSLYYGRAFQWSIESKSYERTVVALRLPIETPRGNEHEAADC